MGRKRCFIDKKHSVTFQLVHRSQRDPLAVDSDAPQLVLAEGRSREDRSAVDDDASGTAEGRCRLQTKYGVYFDDDYDYLQHLKLPDHNCVLWAPPPPSLRTNSGKTDDRKAEDATEKRVRLNLPSSVFASHVQDPVGWMNRAAAAAEASQSAPLPPGYSGRHGTYQGEQEEYHAEEFEQLHLSSDDETSDADVDGHVGAADDVAAGDDRSVDGDLEDDFVELAGGMASSDDGRHNSGSEFDEWTDSDGSENEDNGRCESSRQNAASVATSTTSSRRHRHRRRRRTTTATDAGSVTSRGVLSTVAMQRLNAQFERLVDVDYDDMKLGALEHDFEADFEGDSAQNGGGFGEKRLDLEEVQAADARRLLSLAEEYERQQREFLAQKGLRLGNDEDASLENVGQPQQGLAAIIENDSQEDETVMLTIYEPRRREERLDCESVLSVGGTTRRHCPAVIDDRDQKQQQRQQRPIRLNRQGCPVGELGDGKLTRRALAELNCRNAADDAGSVSSSAGSDGGETLLSRVSQLSVRPAGETSEERRARKHELKALRRQRIEERKASRRLTSELMRRHAQSRRDALASRQAIVYQ